MMQLNTTAPAKLNSSGMFSVRPAEVVKGFVVAEFSTRIGHVDEPMHVETLSANGSVERFSKAVLSRKQEPGSNSASNSARLGCVTSVISSFRGQGSRTISLHRVVVARGQPLLVDHKSRAAQTARMRTKEHRGDKFHALKPFAVAIVAICFFQLPAAAQGGSIQQTRFVDLLAQSAAVVEGEVVEIRNRYSPAIDAWTEIEFGSLVVHRGKLAAGSVPHSLTILQRGGEAPGGVLVRVSINSDFTVGERYVLLLRNTSWYHRPYHGHPFRVASRGGRTFLVGDNQNALVSVSADSLGYSKEALFKDRDEGLKPPRWRRAGYEEIPGRSVPTQALGIPNFLQAIDAVMLKSGIRYSGKFREQPANMSPRLGVARDPRHAGPPPSQEELDRSARAPGERDTAKPTPEGSN